MYKLLLLLVSFNTMAAPSYWQRTDLSQTDKSNLIQEADTQPSQFQLIEFNKASFAHELLYNKNSDKIVSLPLPNGEFEEFSIQEVSIMSENLAIKYPEFKTYRGQSLKGNKTLVLDVTHKGLNAVINSATESVWINPISRFTNTSHMSYYKRDLQNKNTNWQCGVEDHDLDLELQKKTEFTQMTEEAKGGQITLPTNGLSLKTYRLAVAATGEYTAFHSAPNAANVTDGMAAIVTAMNRVNGVFEVEVGIRMVLIDNNDQIVFTDPVTDDYSNDDGLAMLTENTTKINATIGSANYDIGHVFSTGGGGIASLGGPCRSNKAQGVTGLNSPVNDFFYIDYVAHEIGHQWTGRHIFNADTNGCDGPRTSSAAYEPGSGSTIMGYAGLCGSLNNTQNRSDPYFNSYSLEQIINYSESTSASSCSTLISTNNQAPVIEAGANYTIPHSTPFTLCAQATDDNDSNLTYNWEQNDLGPAGDQDAVTGNAPAFRSYRAVADNCRTFPMISSILNGTTVKGEHLPDYQRNMNFRATARDNELNGGGIGTDDMLITVTENGPFRLTSHDINNTIVTGIENSFSWDVANTNTAPVNCATVDIDFSQDGGLTFANAIMGIPNTGSGKAIVPGGGTNNIRVRIKCSDNIFFDINDTNLTSVDDLIYNNGFESN